MTGVLVSDIVATVVFTAALIPILLKHADPGFSWSLLRPVLSFGLPKVPHGLLVQVQNLADRKLLDLFLPRASVGIYHVGYLVGTGVKFALSAFEPAWGPFVYSQISRPDAPRTLARVVTFAWFAFCLVGLGVAALAGELLLRTDTRSSRHFVPPRRSCRSSFSPTCSTVPTCSRRSVSASRRPAATTPSSALFPRRRTSPATSP